MRVLLGNVLLLSVLPVFAALQCHGMLLCYLLIARQRQQATMLNAALEYNRALAQLRHMKRRMVRRRRLRRKPGRTDQWWRNLFEGRMLESEWKKNFRMSRDVFMILVDEVRRFLEPRRGPRGDGGLVVLPRRVR